MTLMPLPSLRSPSLKIHATDAGAPRALGPSGFGDRFHAWRGASGRRYLMTVFDIADVATVGDSVVILVKRDGRGARIPVWVGRSGHAVTSGLAVGRAKGACEAHVHFAGDAEAHVIERDLASPARRRPLHQGGLRLAA